MGVEAAGCWLCCVPEDGDGGQGHRCGSPAQLGLQRAVISQDFEKKSSWPEALHPDGSGSSSWFQFLNLLGHW